MESSRSDILGVRGGELVVGEVLLRCYLLGLGMRFGDGNRA